MPAELRGCVFDLSVDNIGRHILRLGESLGIRANFMSVGKLMRQLLGRRFFPQAAKYYRRVFVDLDKVADCVCDWIPGDAHVLDIGGGDGETLNPIMARRPDLCFTLIDVSPCVGGAVALEHNQRVRLMPGVSVRQYIDRHLDSGGGSRPSCILLSDVVHHIPLAERSSFLSEIRDLFLKTNATLLIKEFEPGSFVSLLGYLSDRFVSGDRNVRFLSRAELKRLIKHVFNDVDILDTKLFQEDRPNYLLVVAGRAEPQTGSR